MSEQELAQAVVAWLGEKGWDVYQEVEVGRGGPRCDVVAVKGRTLWAIECKASLGLAVLGQAHAWLGHAHRVSVATRAVKSEFGARVAREFGIGWLAVSGGGSSGGSGGGGGGRSGRRRSRGPLAVRARVAPARRARISRRLEDALCAEQKSFAPAGNARARFWSPWKGTAAAVRAWVAAHPGGPFAAMVREVEHHYRTQATARSCLRRHIEDGLVEGVSLCRRGGRLVLVLVGSTAAAATATTATAEAAEAPTVATPGAAIEPPPGPAPATAPAPAGVFALLPPSSSVAG